MSKTMGSCKFVNELNRLRKSSSDSIDNVESFDPFKVYMHVTRTAEEDLKNILRKVNDSGKKNLILLCGSAGDGKSHLLSYLKNSDEENLLEGYTIYNDATESNSPSKTAIETLNELLDSFKDVNLESPGKNIILAINLGVLSNFIESEYGEAYWNLKTYVEKCNILTSKVDDNGYDSRSHFQHVSFSDYHMYSLTENGVHAGYIEDILDKVFGQNEGNRFFESYESDCSSCPLSKKCPVKANYEFMMQKSRQRFVAELLVKTVVQDKMVLTTREILNFVFDILVSNNFSFGKFQKLIDDSSFLKEYMKQITPSLIFDSNDVTPLMNMVRKYDPLLVRSEKSDEIAIAYYVSSDISKDIKDELVNVTYRNIILDSNMEQKINNDKVLRSQLFNLVVRISAIEKQDCADTVYQDFVRNLYMYNAGKGKKLGQLYGMIEEGVTQWCGKDQDDNLCLDDKHKGFILYENVKFDASLDHIPHPENTDELFRFVPTVTVAFIDEDDEVISLDIDYSLYELVYKLNRGYIQTADDRNNHADFISFVNRILQTGSLAKSLSIVSDDGKKAVISQGKFGYKFKVVK